MVIDELGHTDPALALRVYRQTISRDEKQYEQLKALVEGVVLGEYGRTRHIRGRRDGRGDPENPVVCRTKGA